MRKPSLKQRAVAKDLLENVGKPIGRAMLDAGYSPATAKNPDHITESKGWAQLMDEHFSDELLTKVGEEGLAATKQLSVRGGKDASAESDDFIEVEDYAVRHKYFETILKMKGRMIDKVQTDGVLEVIVRRAA